MERIRCAFGGDCEVQGLVDKHTALDKERIKMGGELDRTTDPSRREKIQKYIDSLNASQYKLVEEIDVQKCDVCLY